MVATPLPPFDVARLALFLAEASGAEKVKITACDLLAGGAIHQNWGIDAVFSGGCLAGPQRLVLRTDAETGVPSSLPRIDEFAILRAAFGAGVTVPEPLFACADPAVIGKLFFVMRRVDGTAQGRIITADPALEPVLPRIAARFGAELARLQTIRPPRADLAFLASPEAKAPAAQIAGFRAYLDHQPNPRPVLEWATRWLETHIPAPLPPVLCHRDFRTGNYMLDGSELTGILDWEFAGWGDPDEDIGWFCCKGWRFARLDRAAGGIADREPFYAAYEAASGRRLDPDRLRYWEIFANVRWAIIALQQSDRVLLGGARDLSTAVIGRRAGECELELLLLLDPPGPPASCRPAAKAPALRNPLRDLPSGLELAELGRRLLLEELTPLLPPERHREAHLVATAIAIEARESASGDIPAFEILIQLTELNGESEPGRSRPQEGRRDILGPLVELLGRFARDLRNGAFETSPSREEAARAILWRLTIARLREANPQFLAAHGIA